MAASRPRMLGLAGAASCGYRLAALAGGALGDTPGPLGCNDHSDPSCYGYADDDEDELILTSQLPKDAGRRVEETVKDRGNEYDYGYIEVKQSYRQPLAATTNSGRVLDPNSEAKGGALPPKDFYKGYSGDCAATVYRTVKKLKRRPPKGRKHSVLKPWRNRRRWRKGRYRRRVDASGRANLTRKQRVKLLDFIETSLFDGDPVMIGVDYKRRQTAINPDKVTDHWLILTNRLYDSKGRVYFYGMDNAPGRWGDEAEMEFYVSPDLEIWKPPEVDGSSVNEYSYLVTNARAVKKKPKRRKRRRKTRK